MKIPLFIRRESQAGFALLMVMVMLAISFLILGATMAAVPTALTFDRITNILFPVIDRDQGSNSW